MVTFAQRDERHPECRPLVHHGWEVRQVASETIESPADHGINLATARGEHEPIERRPAGLRPADALVYELDARWPTARHDVPPQFEQLILGVLLVGADAGVERDPHRALRVWEAAGRAIPFRPRRRRLRASPLLRRRYRRVP